MTLNYLDSENNEIRIVLLIINRHVDFKQFFFYQVFFPNVFYHYFLNSTHWNV